MKVHGALTCVTLSVTLCVRSLTFGAMIVFSDDDGEGHLFSLLASEKLSAIRGILLMVLYLLRLESEVEPSRLDLIWLSGPERKGDTLNTLIKVSMAFHECWFSSWTLRGRPLVQLWLSWHGFWTTCGVSSTTAQHNRYWNMITLHDLPESTALWFSLKTNKHCWWMNRMIWYVVKKRLHTFQTICLMIRVWRITKYFCVSLTGLE